MSWRRFSVLLSGLSRESVYRLVTRGGSAQRLRGRDAAAFFASFRKAGS